MVTSLELPTQSPLSLSQQRACQDSNLFGVGGVCYKYIMSLFKV